MIQMYHITFALSIAFCSSETKGGKCIIMNKKQETNAFVRDCITTALLQLMSKKPISETSIIELVERAGVARVSFYRNFTSKENVIEVYLTTLIEEWNKDFKELGDTSKFSDSLIRHFYKHKDFYLMLYKQNLSNMIYENLRSACEVNKSNVNLERYGKSMLAGMLFGWLDEWMRQGMPESPDEIALLSNQINT